MRAPREGRPGSRAAAVGLALAIACAGTTAAIGLHQAAAEEAQPAPDSAGRLLPDLVQILPGRLDVFTRGSGRRRRTLLAFGAAAENFGAGPLIVKGSRPSRSSPTMAATQVVMRSDGSKLSVPNVGTLRYVSGGGHSHWHLRGFMRFELRTPAGEPLGRRDRKTGFCLGDRYPLRHAELPARAPRAVYTSRCGLRATGRLRLVQGISVGYGDDYDPYLEGQSLSLRGLPSGRYVLVHRVNPGRRLRESSYGNNAASVLLELSRQAGAPRVRVLRRCRSASRCG